MLTAGAQQDIARALARVLKPCSGLFTLRFPSEDKVERRPDTTEPRAPAAAADPKVRRQVANLQEGRRKPRLGSSGRGPLIPPASWSHCLWVEGGTFPRERRASWPPCPT